MISPEADLGRLPPPRITLAPSTLNRDEGFFEPFLRRVNDPFSEGLKKLI